ncbi:hypothetical protein FOTG_12843 [Fusarium oxysporum f. sp. vasinfectum 25433]|uniref:Nucleoside phosphorylase domain-containing protein n=1 Tax=Fusarium oxysporum f. sp. vasinfectum 25433 TaxID=1089449 RepID=X0KZJ7_FUSOX|nr:hypothetical protein FOTG_12843 [Fusarium oxysporum f. sp. vasinfectum 25433]
MPEDDEAIALEEYIVGWLCALPLEMAAAKGILQRIKDKFGYQGASNDRLYQADYDHVKSENPTCNECDKSHIIHRIDRDDNDPYFHYGIIASGSAAVKDGKTRQRLSEEYGALCFGTEAAGLYDFPCLIIRGIYDYADSHISNLWQEYAAATAAAFAKELLLFVAPGRVRREKTTFYEVASIVKDGFRTSVSSLAEQKYIKHMLNNQPTNLYMVDSARYNSEDAQESTRCEDGTRPLSLEAIEQQGEQFRTNHCSGSFSTAKTGASTGQAIRCLNTSSKEKNRTG